MGLAHFAQIAGKVLIPQPHNHPNDLLNWKLAIMFGQIVIAFVQSVGPLSIFPHTEYYISEWDRSLAENCSSNEKGACDRLATINALVVATARIEATFSLLLQ
ncbi:hypothetical protein V1506DRAFT_125336 [Lipomyces tetrasporus]